MRSDYIRARKFCAFSRGNDSAVAVFAGQPAEPMVEGDQRGLNFLGIGEKNTISDCFCRRLRGERLGHVAERRVQIARLGIKFHPRVFELLVVDSPGFTEGHGSISHPSLQPSMRLCCVCDRGSERASHIHVSEK